jgi:hypothetical protein
MEDLYDDQVAERHLIAQRGRGGHHPGFMPDPVPRRAASAAPSPASETNHVEAKPSKRARATRRDGDAIESQGRLPVD